MLYTRLTFQLQKPVIPQNKMNTTSTPMQHASTFKTVSKSRHQRPQAQATSNNSPIPSHPPPLAKMKLQIQRSKNQKKDENKPFSRQNTLTCAINTRKPHSQISLTPSRDPTSAEVVSASGSMKTETELGVRLWFDEKETDRGASLW